MESDSIFFQFFSLLLFRKQHFQLLEKQENNNQKQTLGGLKTLKLRSKVELDLGVVVLHHL